MASAVPLATRPPLTAGRAARTLSRLIRRRGALIAVIALLVLVGSAVAAPLVAPYHPNTLDPVNAFAEPSRAHWFGTDELGRDLLSRLLYGGRIALLIAALATVLAMAAGIVWGGLSAVARGWLDDFLMRIVDTVMAIPMLLLSLILVAAFQASTASLVIIIGVLHAPIAARMMRAAILTELQGDYCTAARACGASRRRILFSEVLPNTLPTLLVQASLTAASAILVEATLSFFGLGVQPPQASWGTLLLAGYSYLTSSYAYAIFPGVFIFIAIWSLNTLGDHLQAVLDPRVHV
jgi:ABC-type dipeptide/oligopeptide/nickel transport system permease subunit